MKLSLITLGCNKNQTDSEFLLAGLANDFEITGILEDAEIIVLSPCSFLNDARDEAKAYIKKLKNYKLEYNCKCLALTGCYAELLKDEVFKDEKDVDLVIGLADVKTFVKTINDFFNGNKIKKFVHGNGNIFGLFDEKSINRINSHPNYGYVKISEGCNNRCSYCLIPTIRGEYRSRKKEVILAEIGNLLDNGVKEINIVSQDIGGYGADIYKNNSFGLVNLLNEIIEENKTKKFWLRLLYLHPKHIDEKLVEVIKINKNICKYIDMPIQHISDKILKNMDRKITKKDILEKILLLKKEIPNVVIRTTFILGFPNETDKDFEELCSFVKEVYFDKVGVFTYSNEKGTKSYNLKDQIPENKKLERAEILMNIQEKIALEKNKKFLKMIDKNIDFLAEEIVDKNTIKGRLFSMAPEVDGFVYVQYDEKENLLEKINNKKFLKAKIYDCNSYDFYAMGV